MGDASGRHYHTKRIRFSISMTCCVLDSKRGSRIRGRIRAPLSQKTDSVFHLHVVFWTANEEAKSEDASGRHYRRKRTRFSISTLCFVQQTRKPNPRTHPGATIVENGLGFPFPHCVLGSKQGIQIRGRIRAPLSHKTDSVFHLHDMLCFGQQTRKPNPRTHPGATITENGLGFPSPLCVLYSKRGSQIRGRIRAPLCGKLRKTSKMKDL